MERIIRGREKPKIRPKIDSEKIRELQGVCETRDQEVEAFLQQALWEVVMEIGRLPGTDDVEDLGSYLEPYQND